METRGWSLKDRGWRPEVRVSRQRMEAGGLSLEDRGWRPEVGVSGTDDGDQKFGVSRT